MPFSCSATLGFIMAAVLLPGPENSTAPTNCWPTWSRKASPPAVSSGCSTASTRKTWSAARSRRWRSTPPTSRTPSTASAFPTISTARARPASMSTATSCSPASARSTGTRQARQVVPLVQPVLVEIGYMNPERWRHIGTGYSSPSYLKKFDIDYLKIDRSFTRNLAPDSSDMALSDAIIVMAHKLELKLIAEGVETPEQRDLMAAAGCDYGHGYLFAKPMPAEQFDAWLRTADRERG